MPVWNPQQTVSPECLDCRGRTRVRICFQADCGPGQEPADMVLVLDRSGSMCGRPMKRMQQAAQVLIQETARASGDPQGRTILGGSRMALVSFAGEAVTEVGLTRDGGALMAAVRDLSAEGDTNHEKAFRRAAALLEGSRCRRKQIILFTDGVSNGGCPETAAAELREAGVEIFCIGLLRRACLVWPWASQPKEDHIAVTDDPEKLCCLFREIAGKLICRDIRGAKLAGCLHPDFKLCQVETPGQGTVCQTEDGCFLWNIGRIRESGQLCLELEVRHVGLLGGRKSIFTGLRYSDCSGGCLCFPDVWVTVRCENCPVEPEPCPGGIDHIAHGCEDVAAGPTGEVTLDGLGRIVVVNALVRKVCPGKRVAVAVVLVEVDRCGQEHPRGTKTLMIPPQAGEECRDVALKCIRFAVPECLREDGCGDSICCPRHFKVRLFANYVDTDFQCCQPETVILP